ncbi:MAG: M57 family metalloprotease [bacterium]|nr:M57 family metalloprotease [bacterium]
MKNTQRKGGAGILLLFILLLAGGAIWFAKNRDDLPTIKLELPGLPAITLSTARTCKLPVTYKIAKYDERFKISEATFRRSVTEAINRWQKESGTEMFTESGTREPVRINLVFGERQRETEMLASLGLSIDQSKASFEKTRKTYDSLKMAYASTAAAYEGSVKNFEALQQAHNDKIAYWNERGGAPKKEYQELKASEDMLEIQSATLEEKRLDLNKEAATLNQLAGVLNQMAEKLNLEVVKYNTGGTGVRNEFEAGVYQEDGSGKRINIYAFENADKLTDVLTHELGHALGLEHNDNSASVMYRLNEGQNQKIVPSDIGALKLKCPSL